jgi:MinD-like ATPase involved in chromosome partitioning or flagellar assembly/predicted acylesterase/phospholipase RssA
MNAETPPGAKPSQAKIITFYSYKGGTGRSMAVANVAWQLANSGKRVLAIDWDLEAPGLHRYFYPFLVDKDLSSSDGIINFVNDYKIKTLTPPPKGEELPDDWYVQYANIRRYAVSVNWDFPDGGRLDFVPPGRQDASYSELINSFNWPDFYERLGGSRFLEAAINKMRDQYDYVLIDSRTGVSDTSGICTVKMPDALVVCFTLNNQSINGAAAVADYVYQQRVKLVASDLEKKSTRQDGKPKFNIFPVMMRLEDTASRKLERRREYARSKKFAQYPVFFYGGNREDYWEKVRIRYFPLYAYEEVLAAFGDKERAFDSLLASVENLTAYLTDGEVNTPLPLPQPGRDEVLKQFEGDTYEPIVTQERPNQAIENAFANLSPKQREIARKIILRLVRVAGPYEAEHSRQLASIKNFDGEAQSILQTLRNFQTLTVEPDKTTGEELVQISPDVSLRDWKQLQGWIKEDRDFLLWRQEIRDVADKWERSRRDESLLLPAASLPIARERLQDRRDDLSQIERDYIQASKERQKRERLERKRQEGKAGESEYNSNRSGQVVERAKSITPLGSTKRKQSENVVLAQEVLRVPNLLKPGEVLKLSGKLKEEKAFTYARRILARTINDPRIHEDKKQRLKIYQQLALCTYKDADLPADERLDRAFNILREVEDLSETKDQETLGLTGAIYKRKWEIDNQSSLLERALFYYLKGYNEGPANDHGYTGINAAFVLDLLAHEEESEAKKATLTSEAAVERRSKARTIREDIVKQVAPLVNQPNNQWLGGEWWYYTTVAEAQFGLGNYDEAVEWLKKGEEAVKNIRGSVPEWEYESTIRQFAALMRAQSDSDDSGEEVEYTPAWKALKEFFGNNAAPVRSAFVGKIGLALSGGGFRASLFHIGMFARLAELDVLRHVEVLSCVSGGSIIGAHYYLEVRHLLQSKPDGEITHKDYIELVKRMEKNFLAGVQRNIRIRVGAELTTNLKMIFLSNYTRTMRAGDLYEREIFSSVEDGEGDKPRYLNNLKITPTGEPDDFSPKYHNWRREAKAPILILNAATLNTGHTWQFTATWMGEPPAGIGSEIDGNDFLRRMYYEEAPEGHKAVRLGHAVSASACVPGLFEPLALDKLYPDRTIRLVDGGVCDNQGIGGLIEQDCTVLLVSDGSGQMGSIPDPSNGLLGVPLRSNTILQARVRAAQYQELTARKRSQLLRGFMFIHLKSDLDVDPVDWIDCQDPFDASDDARPAERRGTRTSYGIAKKIQERLAAIRTDLDSFSDAESYALMTSAYRMTEHQLKNGKCVQGFQEPKEVVDWDFLAVEEGMREPNAQYRYLMKLLGASNSLAFKIWKLSKPLKYTATLLGLAVFALAVWACFHWGDNRIPPTLPLKWLGIVLLIIAIIAVAPLIISKWLVRFARLRNVVTRMAIIIVGLLGFVIARLHLLIFDKMFLRSGSLEKFNRQGTS